MPIRWNELRLPAAESSPKTAQRRDSLEALLFGQSGLLQAPAPDEYSSGLLEEYRFQRHKLGIEPIPLPGWKFLRMRPRNFPTIRLATRIPDSNRFSLAPALPRRT